MQGVIDLSFPLMFNYLLMFPNVVVDCNFTTLCCQTGPAESLFGTEYYQRMQTALKSDGLLLSQGMLPMLAMLMSFLWFYSNIYISESQREWGGFDIQSRFAIFVTIPRAMSRCVLLSA